MFVDHFDEIDQLIRLNDGKVRPSREPKVNDMVFIVTLVKRQTKVRQSIDLVFSPVSKSDTESEDRAHRKISCRRR